MMYERMNQSGDDTINNMEHKSPFSIDAESIRRLKEAGGIDEILESNGGLSAEAESLKLVGLVDKLLEEFSEVKQELVVLRGDILAGFQGDQVDLVGIKDKVGAYVTDLRRRFYYSPLGNGGDGHDYADDGNDDFVSRGYECLAKNDDVALPAVIEALQEKLRDGVTEEWLMSQTRDTKLAIIEFLKNAAQELMEARFDQVEENDFYSQQETEKFVDEFITKARTEADKAIKWLAI